MAIQRGTISDIDALFNTPKKSQDLKKGTMEDIDALFDKSTTSPSSKTNAKNLGTLEPIKIKPTEYDDAVDASPLTSLAMGLGSIGKGITQGDKFVRDKFSQGINKLLGTNLPTNRYTNYTNQQNQIEAAVDNARARAGKTGTDWWRIGGEILGALPMGAAGVGKTLTTTAGRSAAVGAGIGGASYAKDADQRISNTVMGGVGGAIGGVAAKKIGDGVTRVVNAKKGNYKDGVKEVLDQGAKHNVRVSVGDAGRNPSVSKTEALMEQVPVVGMAGFREAQQNEAKAAATKVTEELRKKMSDVDYKSLSKIQDAANNGNKNAMRILSIVNQAGDDAGRVLQAAAEIKNWRGQQVANQMYDKVSQLAGNNPVAPNKTIQAINNVAASDSKVVPNKELLKEIGDIKAKLTDPSINTSFTEMRSARSRLGELVDEWGQQGKSTSGLTQIRSAIDDDLADFANNSGNPALFSEYKRADSYYKQMQSSKDKALAKSLRSQTPDEIYNQFIKVGKGDRAANFYKNLDPKGQAALRYEMANQALNKATNESTGVFSPAKFALEFERMSEPYSNIFSGSNKAEMDGFVKLMRHIERAGQYAENPPTGNRMVGVAIGGTAVANAPLAIKVATASAIAKALFTTNAGKRILLASKDLPPGSPKLANLIKQAQQLGVTTGATLATE